MREAGPDAPPQTPRTSVAGKLKEDAEPEELPMASKELSFHFSPRMDGLVNPSPESLPHGSDAWAIHNAKASVTPLRAAFAESSADGLRLGTEQADRDSLLPGRLFRL